MLELLATRDERFLKEHIEGTSIYQRILAADEARVAHFTCEENYSPVWVECGAFSTPPSLYRDVYGGTTEGCSWYLAPR